VHENKNLIFFTVSALAHRRVLFADGEDSYAKTSHAGAGGRGNSATGQQDLAAWMDVIGRHHGVGAVHSEAA
jgi:hypothetical protein